MRSGQKSVWYKLYGNTLVGHTYIRYIFAKLLQKIKYFILLNFFHNEAKLFWNTAYYYVWLCMRFISCELLYLFSSLNWMRHNFSSTNHVMSFPPTYAEIRASWVPSPLFYFISIHAAAALLTYLTYICMHRIITP